MSNVAHRRYVAWVCLGRGVAEARLRRVWDGRELMSRRLPRRLVPAALLVILALPVGGFAQAYWSGTGSGAGSATTGTAAAVTLTPGTPAASLYPGGQANVVLTVSNPNAFSVRIASFAIDTTQGTLGFAVDAGHSACLTSTLSFSAQTNGGVGWTAPANGTLPVTLTNALAMSVSAANACQGATTTVYLVAGP